MNCEIVNGVTGIISAICAVISLGYMTTHKQRGEQDSKYRVLSDYQLMSFMLLCSGWVLSCLSFLWFMEPYGRFVSNEDYQNFFGVVLGLPAFIILLYGIRLLQGDKNET